MVRNFWIVCVMISPVIVINTLEFCVCCLATIVVMTSFATSVGKTGELFQYGRKPVANTSTSAPKVFFHSHMSRTLLLPFCQSLFCPTLLSIIHISRSWSPERDPVIQYSWCLLIIMTTSPVPPQPAHDERE